MDKVFATGKSSENTFVLVEASKLSLDDDFMKFKPMRRKTKKFKKELESVIKKGVNDFYRPRMDPAFLGGGKNLGFDAKISFEVGREPATEMMYSWWDKVAREFNPEHGSRLGTRSEYIAFLGVLIKILVEIGLPKTTAWNLVCNNSKKLGHYWNSKNAKHCFELTGSRCICGFFDLANTYKLLAEDVDEGGFWLASGCYSSDSHNTPLSHLLHYSSRPDSFRVPRSVGWIICET